MGDREMLELAARAAGYDHLVWTPGASPIVPGAFRVPNEKAWWNPLIDDGDALRLAAKLKIDLEWQNLDPFPEPAIEAYRREGDSYFIASEHEDNYRRAIVRAAAELARAQGEKQ